MKAKTHLRVGYDKRRRTAKVVANGSAQHAPLARGDGTFLPTVAFAVELEIPDRLFARAEQVIATLTIPEDAATIAAEVRQ